MHTKKVARIERELNAYKDAEPSNDELARFCAEFGDENLELCFIDDKSTNRQPHDEARILRLTLTKTKDEIILAYLSQIAVIQTKLEKLVSSSEQWRNQFFVNAGHEWMK